MCMCIIYTHIYIIQVCVCIYIYMESRERQWHALYVYAQPSNNQRGKTLEALGLKDTFGHPDTLGGKPSNNDRQLYPLRSP